MNNVMSSKTSCDYLIIGGGIIGLTVARELCLRIPGARITLIEKEHDVAQHSSGRNSGVLHAGFYYTADSLKARFTRKGNQLMKAFCQENNLRINPCGKLVVAQGQDDIKGLEELKRRGDQNGIELIWMNPDEVRKIDPNAKTYERALYSPSTATVDPKEVCQTLKRDIQKLGVNIHTGTPFLGFVKERNGFNVRIPQGNIEAGYIVNCAGLYADQVAKSFGLGQSYVVLPFKGIYLSYPTDSKIVRTNIYPVPNLANPFLGVHFTVMVDGKVKFGPTAIPAFWRENYQGLSRFILKEVLETVYYQSQLFTRNSFGFRDLAFSEFKKYSKSYLRKMANGLVRNAHLHKLRTWTQPGIRAQLLNTKTRELVQDFVIEKNDSSLHVLNAVSPGFTCSFSMAQYVVDLIKKDDPSDSFSKVMDKSMM